MWIRRDDYLALLRENSSLSAEVKLYLAAAARQQREIDYWRGRFEAEQRRADRIADKDFEVRGQPPVSDLGISERQREEDVKTGLLEKLKDQMKEITADIFNDAEGDPTPEPGKVELDPALLTALIAAKREK